MEDIKVARLDSIEIRSLWGEYDIEWQLKPDINVLVGVNGSGKSTLLEIVYHIIHEASDQLNRYEFDEVKLTFDGEQFIFAEHRYLPDSKKFESTYLLTSSFQKKFIKSDNGEMKFIEFHFADFIHMDKISTFDMTLKPTHEPFYAFDKAITTELDAILIKLIDDFKDYQLKLRQLEKEAAAVFDEKIKTLSAKEDATYEELQTLRATLQEKEQQISTIYDQRDHFFRELNTLFEKTHKTVDFDKSNALVFYRENGKQIKPYDLSAGEKQILVILLKVILQENRPYILLLDEPEISLHLSWQTKLIEIIRTFNSCCQLIIITHAPAIFEEKWQDKVTRMEAIMTRV